MRFELETQVEATLHIYNENMEMSSVTTWHTNVILFPHCRGSHTYEERRLLVNPFYKTDGSVRRWFQGCLRFDPCFGSDFITSHDHPFRISNSSRCHELYARGSKMV